jgi:hypothetical protein
MKLVFANKKHPPNLIFNVGEWNSARKDFIIFMSMAKCMVMAIGTSTIFIFWAALVASLSHPGSHLKMLLEPSRGRVLHATR